MLARRRRTSAQRASDRCLISLSAICQFWADCYLVATSFRGTQSYSESACWPPAGTRILARCGTYLIRDLTLVRGLGAGAARVLVSLDYLPIAEGVLPSSPLQFRDEIADQKCSDVVSGVGMPMLTEFRLWVLSTIVMVARVIF